MHTMSSCRPAEALSRLAMQAEPKAASSSHGQSPVLCSGWASDASKIFSGGCCWLDCSAMLPVRSPVCSAWHAWEHLLIAWQHSAQTAMPAEHSTMRCCHSRAEQSSQLMMCCLIHLRLCRLCAAGCSGEVHVWDLQSNQSQPVGKHNAPVRHLQHLPSMGLLVTGSWDRCASVCL